MPRRRRYIRSKRVFILSLRVADGLPFAALMSMELLILSAIARTQRDNKIILCDHLWMGNHVHFLFVSLCPEACANFYQELQKKLCDALKRLLGVKRLRIWEGDPVLAEVLDLEAAIEKIAYLYANPARANLVDSISDYPGLSSWKQFQLCASGSVDQSLSILIPWVRLPSIPKLPRLSLSEKQDSFLKMKLLQASHPISHPLLIAPNSWMKVFGIKSPEEVKEVNNRIIQRIKSFESEAREKRLKNGKKVFGKEALKRQSLFQPHTPKPRERRVFVVSSIPKLRLDYIKAHDEISRRCSALYSAWRLGASLDLANWPPGTFLFPLRTTAAALA